MPNINLKPSFDALIDGSETVGPSLSTSAGTMPVTSVGKLCVREQWLDYRIGLQSIKDMRKNMIKNAVRDCIIGDIEGAVRYEAPETVCADNYMITFDGFLHGLPEDPDSWYSWTVEPEPERYYRHGAATYDVALHLYSRALFIMHASNTKKHLTTFYAPDGELYSLKDRYDNSHYETVKRQHDLIMRQSLIPTKYSENENANICIPCKYRNFCHFKEIPVNICGTCKNMDNKKAQGIWQCAQYKTVLGEKVVEQSRRCNQHVYLPGMLPYKINGVNNKENSVEYRNTDGSIWKNGPKDPNDPIERRLSRELCSSSGPTKS